MAQRRALVTGSARGIGAAIARQLAQDGMEVVGVDVLEGAPHTSVQADLSSWEECLELTHRVGAIDVLVNNAAILIEKPVDVFTKDEFERTVAVNLRAPFLLTRELIQGMQKRGYGRVVNISSVGARTGGLSQSAVYSTTKAGLLALTKHFARVYGQYGITVNAIAPGAIDTPMTQGQRERNPRMEAETTAVVPLRRWGVPDEIAAVVGFLSSERASFVTGATIDVNGGWIMT